MSTPPRSPANQLVDLAGDRSIYDVLLEHAYRGVRVQLILRAVLVAFVVLVVVFVPPAHDRTSCYLIASCYGAWSIAVGLLTRRGGEAPVRFIWLALFADVVALAALSLVAGNSAQESWTADLVINGFFLIPMLAATQLRPWVCTVVVVPTVGVYLASSAASRQANIDEPWASILLRTGVLAGLSLGCVLLSYVQRSRVLTIGALVSDRSQLLAEMVSIEDRERRDLAENLHDGALQYVLAARQDLDDARDGDAESFERIDHALRESSQLLRTTMTELHPAVLEQAGLAAALRDLIRAAQARGGFEVELDASGWGDGVRTSADALLFATARELLNNVVKHADATAVRITLRFDGQVAALQIADNGRGLADGVLERRLAEGHIGLASRRVRLEAAGGRLALYPADPTGTVADVELPAH